MSPIQTRVLSVVIFLSGAAALVHEVVWHRYLAILLGGQARATALTLAIFLGGLSVGYAWFGERSRRAGNLWSAVAVIELGIALWAWSFPWAFRLAFSGLPRVYAWVGMNSLLPEMALAGLLMGAPAFLMGGTLPLLTQAMSEDLLAASRTHAWIYGLNTVGAAMGCFLTGYLLLPLTSLPVATRLGAAVNLAIAAILYFGFARRFRTAGCSEETTPAASGRVPWNSIERALLLVGFLSGLYLTTLEVLLIRLMGLSAGSSDYHFTLVVSLVILGLGLGSLLARRISRYTCAHLFWNQLGLSVLLGLLFFSADCWPYVGHLIRISLRDLPWNFYFYEALLALAASLVLLPPLIAAGRTLPLCFHLLKQRKATLGERVGQLYALNTVGAVMGAVLGGYVLFYLFNLDQLFKGCIFAALFSTVIAGYVYFPDFRPGWLARILALAVGMVVAVLCWRSPGFAKERFLQAFRFNQPFEASFQGPKAFGEWFTLFTPQLLWMDGPTSSVGIGINARDGKEVSRSIYVNGKSDGNTRGDLFTTSMLGHIPALLSAKSGRACVIGFGTGITGGTLAQYPDVSQVDIVEISGAVIKSASLFDAYDHEVSREPKAHFYEMDAFRFFGATPDHFGIVVSEPSNPWMAGVENLYTREFYRRVRESLDDEGVFVQWIHSYSFNDELLRLVLNTIHQEFPEVSVLQLTLGDLALVATKVAVSRKTLERAASRMRVPRIAALLRGVGIRGIESLLAMEVVPARLTGDIAANAGVQTLESPRLSQGAAKAFFVGDWARPLALRRQFKNYYASTNDSLLARWQGGAPLSMATIQDLYRTFCEHPISGDSDLCHETVILRQSRELAFVPSGEARGDLPARDLQTVKAFALPPETNFAEPQFESLRRMLAVYKSYLSPLVRLPKSALLERVDRCLQTVPVKEGLYGKCLLEKVEVYQTEPSLRPQFVSTSKLFLEWLPGLSPHTYEYAKFAEARDLLVKVVN